MPGAKPGFGSCILNDGRSPNNTGSGQIGPGQSIRIKRADSALDFPGGNDEPGHRDIPVQSHLRGDADSTDGPTSLRFMHGGTEREAEEQGVKVKIGRFPLTALGRARVRTCGIEFRKYSDLGFTAGV